MGEVYFLWNTKSDTNHADKGDEKMLGPAPPRRRVAGARGRVWFKRKETAWVLNTV